VRCGAGGVPYIGLVLSPRANSPANHPSKRSLAAVDNDKGVIGIAPGATVRVVSQWFETPGGTFFSTASAIASAILHKNAGDVLLVETTAPMVSKFGWVPQKWIRSSSLSSAPRPASASWWSRQPATIWKAGYQGHRRLQSRRVRSRERR
jgi:hypothetical protein